MYVILTEDREIMTLAAKKKATVFMTNQLTKKEIVEEEKEPVSANSAAYKLNKFIDTFAIPRYWEGYKYLRYIFNSYLYESQDFRRHVPRITRELYPKVAEAFNATPSSVERTVRHAIAHSYECVPDQYDILYGYKLKKRPTNKDFIISMYNYINKTFK